MTTIMRLAGELIRDERGIAAVEYGLVCAVIGVVLATSLRGVSTGLTNTFNTISQALSR